MTEVNAHNERTAEGKNILVLLAKTGELVLRPSDPEREARLDEVSLVWSPEERNWVIETDAGNVNLDEVSIIDDDGTVKEALDAMEAERPAAVVAASN